MFLEVIDLSFDESMENTKKVPELTPISVTPSTKLIIKPMPKSKKKQIIEKANDLCLICGDQAKGKKNGVLACNGCGLFFIKVGSGEIGVGNCARNNSCQINRTTRNKCRSCRYKMCVNAGMCLDEVNEEVANNESNEESPADHSSDNLHESPVSQIKHNKRRKNL